MYNNTGPKQDIHMCAGWTVGRLHCQQVVELPPDGPPPLVSCNSDPVHSGYLFLPVMVTPVDSCKGKRLAFSS